MRDIYKNGLFLLIFGLENVLFLAGPNVAQNLFGTILRVLVRHRMAQCIIKENPLDELSVLSEPSVSEGGRGDQNFLEMTQITSFKVVFTKKARKGSRGKQN